VGELAPETRLGAIRLRAADAGLLRDFYERAIGLRPVASGNAVTALGAEDEPLVELVSDPDAPVMPGGAVLGHVHLQVGDLGAAEAFWVDGLGFDVVVRGYPGALFVSAGGYHHHVGLNTWAGVGAPRPPEGAQGLDRFEIVVPDEPSLSAARERLAAVAEVDESEAGLVSADASGNPVLIRRA
jgi:catechol 2,3-dioxygenase